MPTRLQADGNLTGGMLNNPLVRGEQSKMLSPVRAFTLLLLLGFPLLEIAVLIEVGAAIGFWATLGLLVLAAVAGMLIIRNQGVSMVGRMFDSMSRGGFAFASMVDGYVVILAGSLLILPGFISDALGLALLVPPLRRLILGAVIPGFTDARRDGRGRPAGPQGDRDASGAKEPIIIEGTYERLDDDDRPR
ncbi:FxsA family protein [Hyphomicrobium sp. NDB2Meth4]|uniref:FxsA family protein n=1 Tax=Hyphomicrobium sp. NDB2Meth4 TaxID=1892846 RepID=UPI0009FA1645|nr:FxsA family protein [Hyphomicrobium sp. NDB2Meth4]